MKIGKSNIEHQADVINNMTNILGMRFFKFSKDLTDKEDMSYLESLAKSVGYMINVSTAVEKTFKHEKRIKMMEDKLKSYGTMHMFEEPQLEKYR